MKPTIYSAAPARSTCAVLFLLIATISFSLADPGQKDTGPIVATVQQFHQALGKGDADGAMRLLASDAIILENGSAETRDTYEGHHLAEDIAFSRAVKSERSMLSVHLEGDVAWIASTSRATGTFHGTPVNSAGTELMVLMKTTDGWRIRAIHWSSHKGK